VSILIHSIRIEFVPVIVSGVAQDVRAALAFQTLSSTGTGGNAVVPAPLNPRNTVAATGTYNGQVTTPGTLAVVKSAMQPSVIVPFERIFTPDQRIPIPGGTRLGINLQNLGATTVASSEIYVEEI
jgi:hypothetical protein